MKHKLIALLKWPVILATLTADHIIAALASPGDVALAIAPAVVAGIAIAGGAIIKGGQAMSGNAQRKKTRGTFREAYQNINPSKIVKTANYLRPQMRSMILGTMGNLPAQQVATSLGRAGLTGMNAASVLKGAASIIPDLAALESAFELAWRIRSGQSEIKMASAGAGGQRQSVGMSAFEGGMQGFLGANSMGLLRGGGGGGAMGMGATGFKADNPIPSFGSKFPNFGGGA